MSSASETPERGASQATRQAPRIWKAASADAEAVAVRMQLAARAAAAERFEQWWPIGAFSPPTRRLLQNWYLHTVEHQLALGITAPADSPIDGVEAERVMAAVRQRTGAPAKLVVETVVTLARDGRAFADRVCRARERLVDSALQGRIRQVFPRAAGVDLSMRQAIAEQWYARCFRAAIEPALHGLATAPVTPHEIYAIGITIATRQPRRLYVGGEPTGPATRRIWHAHCAELWSHMDPGERAGWLHEQHFATDLARLPFAELPSLVQSDLLREFPPTELILTQDLATGSPIQAAAEAFDTRPIQVAGPAEIAACHHVFRRTRITIPTGMINAHDSQPVIDILNRLHRANNRAAEMRGHPSQRWWTVEGKLDRAIDMRTNGKTYAEIGRELDLTADQVIYGLRNHGDIPELVEPGRRGAEWTRGRVLTTAALRQQGMSYDDIGAALGVSGGAIRSGFKRHAPTFGIDPGTGHSIGGVGIRADHNALDMLSKLDQVTQHAGAIADAGSEMAATPQADLRRRQHRLKR